MTNKLLRVIDGLTPARLVWLLALYAAAALLLAACTQQTPPEEEPPPDPALELALDQAAVEIVRGATALIEVTVVRTATVTEPVELNVVGALPPGVSATFDPASLSGSEDVSTLTVAVEASAAETNLDLEVNADAGGLSSGQLLKVEIVGLVVNGRLEDSYGQPLPGGRAGSQGKFALIGSDGSFTLEGLAVPYDLMVGSGPGKRFHVFEGLTAPEPVLVPYAMLHEPTGSSTALIEGLLLDGDPLAENERVDVCVQGHAVVIYSCARASSGDDEYSFQTLWYEAASQSATLHAIHYELGADDETVDFLGYDQRDVTLTNGVPVAWDIEFKPIDSSYIEGDVVRGAGTNPGSLFTIGMVRFGETLTMPVGGVQNDPDFALLMPRLPPDSSGAGPYDVLVMDGYVAPYGSLAWRTGVEEDAGQVRLLDLPELSGPLDGQLGVSFSTPFAVSGYEGQVKTFTWTGSNGPGPHIALTTTRDEVTIPDPAALGLNGMLSGYPEMSWMVTSSMHPDVDSATEEYREWSDPVRAMFGIGPLPANFGRYAWAMQGTFVFGSPLPV